MVYMGSKSKYLEYLVPLFQKIIDEKEITTYVEPFVGGANVIDKIKCEHKIGSDKSYSLIKLHRQAQSDFSLIPEHGSRELWDRAKEAYRATKGGPLMETSIEPYLVGAIQFFGSFSNGGFARGYAKNVPGRDYYNEAYRNFANQIQAPLYQDIQFYWYKYNEVPFPDGSFIYCDPPYQGTKPYGYAFENDFDYNAYWNWVREVSKNNYVICSEQTFPEDFEILWTQPVKRTTNKENNFKAIEKLGTYKNGLLMEEK